LAVRMKDIAQDLGVSLMTVSKALRSHTDISEQTRKRVMKRARELDYKPNWIARSLVTRRTYTVGVVIPDLMHSFFAEVAKGIARTLEPHGYQIVISNSDESVEAEQRQIEMLTARNVDGLIVASALPNWRRRVSGMLRESKTPVVLIDRLPAGIDANYIGVSDEEIGALATGHLYQQGCRRIAHIRGDETPNSVGRLRGYRKVLAKHGLKSRHGYIVGGGRDDEGGCAAMRQLLALPEPPDGVFCYNDPVAAGAIRAVLDAGKHVPADVAIIGAGNVHYSDLLRVPLSTVDQSSAAIGEKAAELLVDCMEAKDPRPSRRIMLPARLVVRESSRRSSQ
jgi:LacI family transcriptional regulator